MTVAVLPEAVSAILPLHAYDRSPQLSPAENAALICLMDRTHQSGGRRPKESLRTLARLILPLEDVRRRMGYEQGAGEVLQRIVLRDVHARATSYWAWSAEEWLATVRRAHAGSAGYAAIGCAYLLAGHRGLHHQFLWFQRRRFAAFMLGEAAVAAAVDCVITALNDAGYNGSAQSLWHVVHALCGLLLDAKSAELSDLGPELIAAAYQSGSQRERRGIRAVVLVLRSKEILAASPLPRHANSSRTADGIPKASPDVPREWADWLDRWHRTSTLSRRVRDHYHIDLQRVGRWLAARHPDITSPAGWTRDTAIEWRAEIVRLCNGDWGRPIRGCHVANKGAPLNPNTRASQLNTVRCFFRDCQEWEWIPPRFDPIRTFALPRTIAALIGPQPRVIADDVWAKLLWAGLNLTNQDMPRGGSGQWFRYPIEMIRAVAAVWLFAGLRRNEILRLRVGCVRWQQEHSSSPSDVRPAVCLLDVPATKTSTAYTKPVDRIVGEAIDRWEAVRPVQPRLTDAKTGETVDFLFVYKGGTLGSSFINNSLIPAMCRKANVPEHDARGALTSHRARATIATQLYNAREPMTLFELQAWLGHRTPNSTQHYARITPLTLTKAYRDAGYFERNLRAIEVLIDREAVQSGAAAGGTPWQYFDLGHGFCTYTFFDQCPHRMACARCDFYIPKESTEAQLLEARANLQRMRAEIPLSDDEVAAIDEGQAAIDRLVARLRDVPTPAGPTPRDLGFTPLPMLLTGESATIASERQREPARTNG